MSEVTAKIGLGQTWVYAQLAKGFPRPIGLEDGQSLGWVESEVDDWLAKLVARRDELAAANPGDPFAATGAKQVRLREARVKASRGKARGYEGREGRCTIAAEAR